MTIGGTGVFRWSSLAECQLPPWAESFRRM